MDPATHYFTYYPSRARGKIIRSNSIPQLVESTRTSHALTVSPHSPRILCNADSFDSLAVPLSERMEVPTNSRPRSWGSRRSLLRGLNVSLPQDSHDGITSSSQSSQSGVLGLTESSPVTQDNGHANIQVGVFDNSNILYEYWNGNFLVGALIILFGKYCMSKVLS